MKKISLFFLIMVFSLIIMASCDFDDFVWHEIGDAGEPAFENGWNNWGGYYETAAFGIDKMGFVHLKGMISDSSYSAYSVIFTMPAGYIPEHTLLITAYAPVGDDDSGSVLIYNDGTIALNDPGVSPGASVSVCLDGIVFYAEL